MPMAYLDEKTRKDGKGPNTKARKIQNRMFLP